MSIDWFAKQKQYYHHRQMRNKTQVELLIIT